MDRSSPAPARPSGWRRELLGILGAIGLVLLAYHSIAFGGRTFDTSSMTFGVNGNKPPTGVPFLHVNHLLVDPAASAWQTMPWTHVTHQEIDAGEVPLWNPYQGGGAPLAANVQSSVFNPFVLVVNLHPTTLTWDLSLLAAFLFGAVAMELFLRSLGLSLLGSVTGTGSFLLCGYFAVQNNAPFFMVYLYLPALFLLIDQVLRSPKLRWVAALGAGIAGCIYGGMPEASFFVLAAAGIYAAYRVVRKRVPRPAWTPDGPPEEETSQLVATQSRIAIGMRLGAAGILGLALAAPLLVAFFEYLPYSFNVHPTGVGMDAVSRAGLLNWIIPFANGYPPQLRVAGFSQARSWLGAAGAYLLVVASASPRPMRRHTGWCFLVLGFVLLLKIHGIPGFSWIGRLPGADRSTFPYFAATVVSFCFAVVVAIAVDAIGEGAIEFRWLVAGTAVLAVSVAVLLVANRSVLAVPPHKSPWRQYLLYAIALGAGGAAMVSALVSVRFPRLRTKAGITAAATVLLELFVLFSQGTFAHRADPYRMPPWLALVARETAAHPEARVFGFDRLLYPDTSGVFGIEDVRDLDALYVSRYVSYIRSFVSSFPDRFTGDLATPAQVEGNPMFNLLGVRYVFTRRTVLNDPAQYRLLGLAAGVHVYENDDSLPRAFVVSDVHEVTGMQAAITYLKGLGHPLGGQTRVSAFDPATQAVVEAPRAVVGPRPRAAPLGGPGALAGRPASIVSYAASRVVIDVPAGEPGLLVLTDTYMPGWLATVNGKPAPVLPTDVAFRGVTLGRGASRVVFSYHPQGEALAWLLPLLGVAGILVAGLAGSVTRFRRVGRHNAPAS